MGSPVTAYLSVGSNIDPERHVPEALGALAGTPLVRVTGVSVHYRTAPLGGRTGQGPYLNGVWAVETRLSLAAFRDVLAALEDRAGRRRTGDRYAARTLDLDLLLWGALSDPDAGLPDGDVLARPFLYGPLLELAPALAWPPAGRPLAELVDAAAAAALEPDGVLTALLKGMIDG